MLLPSSDAGTPASTTISYATAANPGITPSVISSLPGYRAHFLVPPHVGSENNSANGTDNLICQFISTNWASHVPLTTTTGGNSSQEDFIQVAGTFYHHIRAHTVKIFSDLGTSPSPSYLMDGGANGGMTGSDVHVISILDFYKANITGIVESALTRLPLVTAAGVDHTHWGSRAIIFLHQYAHHGKGHTIHSTA
jgi:hypothetical protein